MPERDSPIRRAAFKQRGGPGSDLLISLFVGLPLAVGTLTLFPPPLGVIAVLIEVAAIAFYLWEGQKAARIRAERQRQRELREQDGA